MAQENPVLKRYTARNYGIVGTLSNSPWWFLVFVLAFVTMTSWYIAYIPATSHREWSPPGPTALTTKEGFFSAGHLNARDSYEFVSDGTTIYLDCRPYIDKFKDCLERSGVNLASIRGKPARVQYFIAKDILGRENILMSATISGRTVLSYGTQVADLVQIARQEDQSGFPIIRVVFCLLSIAVALFSMYDKWTRANRPGQKPKVVPQA